MEKMIIIRSLFPFAVIWGLTLIFLWFRPRVEIFWKIVATVIFAFYLWFFREEYLAGLASFRAEWFAALVLFLKEMLLLVFFSMFLFWPVALVVIFYKADDFGAERLLKFMCLFTIVLWIIVSFYVFFDKGIDSFLFEKLRQVLPR